MKRFHVHVAVDDLNANIRFYCAAKWLLRKSAGMSNRMPPAATRALINTGSLIRKGLPGRPTTR